MTTCVHCDEPGTKHSVKGACPTICNRIGKPIDWHPTNRFTPRSEEQVMSEHIEPQCSCSVRERDSGHKTDCVYASGQQESPAAVQPLPLATADDITTFGYVPPPAVGAGDVPKGFISGPTLEDLQPTEAEKAKFAQLFAWLEASKHSDFHTGPIEQQIVGSNPTGSPISAEAVAERILKSVPLHLVSSNEFAEQALFDAIVQALKQPCPRCADLERERDEARAGERKANEYREKLRQRLREAENANALAVAKIDEQRRTNAALGEK